MAEIKNSVETFMHVPRAPNKNDVNFGYTEFCVDELLSSGWLCTHWRGGEKISIGHGHPTGNYTTTITADQALELARALIDAAHHVQQTEKKVQP